MSRSSSGPWFYAAKGSWHNGKRVNLHVKGEGSKAEAVRAWHRLLGGITPEPVASASSATSAPTPEPKANASSLPELVNAFLADAATRIKPESHRGYVKFLKPFADAFASTSPARLTAAAVERFSKKREWSQSYRCGFIGTVVTLFKWAVDSGRIDRNSVAGIRKPAKQRRGRKAVISEADHVKLVTHAEGDWKDFLQLLWLSGARPGEIAGLEAVNVDTASKCAILREHKTAEQTGRDQLIVLPDKAVAILGRLIAKRPTGLLFPGEKGQRLSANNVSCRMRRLCERAGVKAFCYAYRHTLATTALANGVPNAHVAALLGHSGTGMLHKHY